MVAFVQGRPVKTDQPTVTVDAGLKVGVHRFQLVVLDSAGLASKADEVQVQVTDGLVPRTPVAPPTPTPPRSRRTP